eukprot:jgi/Orpsp1_1/1178521/evm.model.c7180000065655.2
MKTSVPITALSKRTSSLLNQPMVMGSMKYMQRQMQQMQIQMEEMKKIQQVQSMKLQSYQNSRMKQNIIPPQRISSLGIPFSWRVSLSPIPPQKTQKTLPQEGHS